MQNKQHAQRDCNYTKNFVWTEKSVQQKKLPIGMLQHQDIKYGTTDAKQIKFSIWLLATIIQDKHGTNLFFINHGIQQ